MAHAKKPPLISLLFLVSFASVGTVSISPALPEISSAFGVSEGGAQHLIMWYLIGYALGQVPFGPLGAYFGNRRVTIGATGAAVLLAALCFLVIPFRSVGYLSAIRFLLGLAMSVGLKMTYTFLALHFTKAEMAKIAAFLMASFALAPSLSVFLSGWLVHGIGYQGALYFQLAYTLLGLGCALWLPPDVIDHHSRSLHPKSILLKYGGCLRNPRILLSGILMGLATSMVYLFATESPFTTINFLQINPAFYGLYYFLAFLGGFFGGIIGGKLTPRLPRKGFIFIGLSLMTLGGLGMFFAFLFDEISPLTLFFPMFVILFGIAFFTSNVASFAMEEEHHKSYISSTINFLNMGLAVVSVLVLSLLHPKNLRVMPSLFVAIVLVAWVGVVFKTVLIQKKESI